MICCIFTTINEVFDSVPKYGTFLFHIFCPHLSLSPSGLIVASLMVCWLPNQIRRLMMAAVPKSHWTLSFFRSYVTLLPVADAFFYLSSVINPFLYNLSSRQFREVFVQVLRCRLTIEHINKRNVQTSRASSSHSFRPLIKSLRRNRGSRATKAQETPVPALQTESDSGVASLSKTEGSDSILKTADIQSEIEV